MKEHLMKMLRSWVVAMCAFLVTIPASAKDKITKLSFEFRGHARVLYVIVPEKQSPMPVVVLLHGSGHNGEIMAQAWRDLAAREGFIVAAPDAYGSAGWGSSVDPPELFQAVVDQVNAIHPVDESRIYLFGHSAGAAYALFLAVIDSFYSLPLQYMPALCRQTPTASSNKPIARCPSQSGWAIAIPTSLSMWLRQPGACMPRTDIRSS
jgi:poly(3-hydroxybutyrate) depolymerase